MNFREAFDATMQACVKQLLCWEAGDDVGGTIGAGELATTESRGGETKTDLTTIKMGGLQESCIHKGEQVNRWKE